MPSTPLGFPYPALTDAPNGPSQMQALALAIDTLVTTMPNGTYVNVLGPATAGNTTYGVGTSTVVSVTGSCSHARQYLVIATISGQKITAAGTMAASLVETTSGFAPPLTGPALTWNGGDLVGGGYAGIWIPNSGQTSMTWSLKVAVGTASYVVAQNCATIAVIDMGT